MACQFPNDHTILYLMGEKTFIEWFRRPRGINVGEVTKYELLLEIGSIYYRRKFFCKKIWL